MSAPAEPMTLDEMQRIGMEAMRVSVERVREAQANGMDDRHAGACVAHGAMVGRLEMLLWIRSAETLERAQELCEWEMLRYSRQVLHP